MDNLSLGLPESKGLSGLLKSLFAKRDANYGLSKTDEPERIVEAVKEANQDLEAIEKLFDNANDPDLIEYAIYEQYAIKLRISYLMKLAKERNIKYINFTSL
ncbi:MAG: DUF2508 family protein [Clostridiales bacterium]|nr:DUF2508 family protein [Clostridiales bacterium]HBM79323.1 hypothetical protein [Clostridiaceae bacterium]